VPHRLRDRHFASVLEALIEYAADGGAYSFNSQEDNGSIVISVTIQDQRAYQAKHAALLVSTPLDQR
jgi:hypothetical protein